MSESIIELFRLMPEFFAKHLLLSMTALALGLSIGLPLAIVASQWRALGRPVLALTGMMQTVPTLALLALMVPLLGSVGYWPTLLALAVCAMLPVLKQTINGLTGVSPILLEAAEGVGMTPWQTLRKVQFPLAMPSMIAGIRTSAVGVVGMATLATPVGQTTLGNYIFTGLQTQNRSAVLLGCVAAAVMALIIDGVIRLIERGAIRRNGRLQLAGVSTFILLLMVGLSPLATSANLQPKVPGRQTLVVGAKTATEQHVLARLLSDRIEEAGYTPVTRVGMNSRMLFESLVDGSIDAYVDYSGTIWTDIMKRQDLPGSRKMLIDMKRWLNNNHGIKVAGRLGFENTYALAMPSNRAGELGVRSMSDLRSLASTLKLGGDVEFFARPEWTRARDVYGLNFGNVVGLASSDMYDAVKDGRVDVLAALSSDGRIPAFDLTVLRDDRNAFPPSDALLLMSAKASEQPEVVTTFQSVLMTIDDDLMRRSNMLVDVKQQSPSDAAKFLATNLMIDSVQASGSTVAAIGSAESIAPVESPVVPVEQILPAETPADVVVPLKVDEVPTIPVKAS